MSAEPATSSTIAPLPCTAVLTHHWLVRERGGEKVLRGFRSLAPDAPIYTLILDRKGVAPDWGRVHTSLLQHLPGAARFYPKLLPLLPAAARQMHLPPADLVLCSDAAIAKAMRPAAGSKLVVYCHSPMRYVFDLADDYARTLPAPLRPLWPAVCAYVRNADIAAARRVDQFVANSKHVAARIQRAYGRESEVIYPPVEVPETPPAATPREDYYVCVGYHVAYKRLDLAVDATRKLGRRLVVVGAGPDVERIDKARDTHVELRGWQDGAAIAATLRGARALLFPGEEDFGIVPVEALAQGCPVVAYGVGGATESVADGESGVWFETQTVDSLVAAMERCERMQFDPARLHAAAWRFRTARFLEELRALCMRVLATNAFR